MSTYTAGIVIYNQTIVYATTYTSTESMKQVFTNSFEGSCSISTDNMYSDYTPVQTVTFDSDGSTVTWAKFNSTDGKLYITNMDSAYVGQQFILVISMTKPASGSFGFFNGNIVYKLLCRNNQCKN